MRTTCMILMIIAAATVFAHLMTLMRIPQTIAAFVADAGVPQFYFWLVIIVLCGILGCFLEAAAILYLVVPVVAPVLPVLGIEHAHFAVIMVVLIELGMISRRWGYSLRHPGLATESNFDGRLYREPTVHGDPARGDCGARRLSMAQPCVAELYG